MRSQPIITKGIVALAAAALLAPAATAQTAQDLRSPDARDAATRAVPVQDLRSPDARDTASGGITRRSIPAPRAVQISPDGFDWDDAGIGATGTLGLVLIAAGASTALTRRRPGRDHVETVS